MNPEVAVLFCRSDSVYKTLPECDVWDAERDARKWQGGIPVVAHPPCAQWGIMRGLANNIPEIKNLAFFAVDKVRKFGGVLEHPKGSKLWEAAALPEPGKGKDEYGGWTLALSQKWFGHLAEKKTLLYIVGCDPKDIPPFPITIAPATHVIGQSRKLKTRPETKKADREHTPIDFAKWLVELARKTKVSL